MPELGAYGFEMAGISRCPRRKECIADNSSNGFSIFFTSISNLIEKN
ncbi:hypothetical protein SAMN05216315_1448 [Nitrosospira sp. Nsp18]|nr:hypothetical protein SAMN05216315_1448 [Nitrosospira sp. Nsp18]